MIKFLLIFLGTVSLILGITGIFVPGLPTTPFLLLTAGCYVKSSDKLYHYLLKNKLVGTYISDFQLKKGMTERSKIYAICMMWLMITLSCIFLIGPHTSKLIVIVIGVIGTIVMGFIVPTVYNSNSKKK
jgi:uncharacterized protein